MHLQEGVDDIVDGVIFDQALHVFAALRTFLATFHPIGTTAAAEAMHTRLDADAIVEDVPTDAAHHVLFHVVAFCWRGGHSAIVFVAVVVLVALFAGPLSATVVVVVVFTRPFSGR